MEGIIEIEIPQEIEEILDDEQNGNDFENYRKNIVTKIAYLIGVPEEKLSNDSKFAIEELDKLRENENATIIRHLCILRTQFFRNYSNIHNARRDFKRVDDLDEYLSIESIIKQNPYRIFIVQMGDDTEATIKNIETLFSENPAWMSLSAVAEGRVHFMEKRLFSLKPNAKWGESYEILTNLLKN